MGQLVKDELFTLFEAVGALEVRRYLTEGTNVRMDLRLTISEFAADNGLQDG